MPDSNSPGSSERFSPAALARYLSEESSSTEKAEIERWISSDPGNRALIDGLRAIWARPDVGTFDADDSMWQSIARRASSDSGRSGGSSRRASLALLPPVRSSAHPLRWATAVVATAAALILVLNAVGRRGVQVTPARVHTAAVARTTTTLTGNRTVFTLADGTKVWLGPQTRLVISAAFADSTGPRDVTLYGDAFFTVGHDSHRPFRVHTDVGVAEDLGTEFQVTDYPETRGMRVVVVSGMVAMRRSSARASTPPLATLTAGMLARLDARGTATVRQGIDLTSYASADHGALTFNDARLKEIIAELSRWYDLNISLADESLGVRRLTASFEGESAREAVRRLAMALGLRAEQHGRRVVLQRP